MTFTTSFAPTERLMTVYGDLDVATAPEFADAALQALSGFAGSLRLNMAGVTFLDSSGISALVKIRNAAGSAGQTLTLENVPEQAARTLHLIGLAEHFGIDPQPPVSAL